MFCYTSIVVGPQSFQYFALPATTIMYATKKIKNVSSIRVQNLSSLRAEMARSSSGNRLGECCCFLEGGNQIRKVIPHLMRMNVINGNSYRKKPLSTCEDGNELDKGKGSSGGNWAIYLMYPLAAAGIIFGLMYYRKARLGRIRLPEASSNGNTSSVFGNILGFLTEIPFFLSNIPVPRRLPSLPSFFSNWRRGGPRYSQLNQDDQLDTDLNLDE
ncbi:hypothetical protein BC936DRAFT_142366 [Jimgerdemannia flammicorona]|uniref:Uncharacterized protein n=1 Tax=Jimgerdemannia flammicorona TaxID=994334 RepID=A0A433A0H9_9FUNG|nr:hypothetical protein BC936DRAFT_142366 [Jimgerdemannia flammicorona]